MDKSGKIVRFAGSERTGLLANTRSANQPRARAISLARREQDKCALGPCDACNMPPPARPGPDVLLACCIAICLPECPCRVSCEEAKGKQSGRSEAGLMNGPDLPSAVWRVQRLSTWLGSHPNPKRNFYLVPLRPTERPSLGIEHGPTRGGRMSQQP